MSAIISRDKLSEDEADSIRKTLWLEPKQIGRRRQANGSAVLFLKVENGLVYLPFHFFAKRYNCIPNQDKKFSPTDIKFSGSLREHQISIVEETTAHLQQYRCATIAVPPGNGKTVMGCYFSTWCKTITVIVTHLTGLADQWYKALEKFTDAKIWYVGNKKTPMPAEANVIICLDGRLKKLPTEYKQNIGMLIVDEAHCFVSQKRAQVFFEIQPRYVIALTATPIKKNGMHIVTELACGSHRVYRENEKPFTYMKVETGIVGVRKLNLEGELIFDKLLKSIALNAVRNQLIVDMVMAIPMHKVLILTKLTDHTTILYNKFVELKESVDFLCGSKRTYKDSRILIGTVSKIGTGFDEENACDDFKGKRLSTAILACSFASEPLLYQNVGRVFRHNAPTVIYLVDNDPTLKRHWDLCRRWFNNNKGVVFKS
jgi:superfamily II DNA or RNA helicase